jgi:hypothetical protein
MNLKTLVQVTAAAACLAWPWPCSAGPQLDVESATNRDGSAIRVRTITDEEGRQRKVWIYFRKPGEARMKLIANQTYRLDDHMAAGLTQIHDWDKNGTHEVSVVKACGAGPNCDGLLFHIDPHTARMVKIFRGDSSSVEYMNGHLVEYGRSSCCAWQADVYAVSHDRLSIAQQPKFSVYMGIRELAGQDRNGKASGQPSDEILVHGKGKEAVICYFFVESPAGRAIRIKPPPGFRRICNFYRPFGD